MKAIEDRLLRLSERRGDCLVWTGSLSYSGYGRIQVNSEGGNTGAHRVAYQVWVGPIPDGLQIDHLCGVRNCIEPTHLEAVTHRENLLRSGNFIARNAWATHCIHGHEFTPENTKVRDKGHRECRTCRRDRHAAEAQRRKQRRKQAREAAAAQESER
jgi:hypothetical protein